MGLTEVLTIVFVILKLTGGIDWNWFWVLSPEIFGIGLGIVWAAIVAAAGIAVTKNKKN